MDKAVHPVKIGIVNQDSDHYTDQQVTPTEFINIEIHLGVSGHWREKNRIPNESKDYRGYNRVDNFPGVIPKSRKPALNFSEMPGVPPENIKDQKSSRGKDKVPQKKYC